MAEAMMAGCGGLDPPAFSVKQTGARTPPLLSGSLAVGRKRLPNHRRSPEGIEEARAPLLSPWEGRLRVVWPP